jgi:hypothetical protein
MAESNGASRVNGARTSTVSRDSASGGLDLAGAGQAVMGGSWAQATRWITRMA